LLASETSQCGRVKSYFVTVGFGKVVELVLVTVVVRMSVAVVVVCTSGAVDNVIIC
jgi:hypothetical protein